WVVQEIDRKMPPERAAHLVEKEWTVISMEARSNSPTFLKLAELLGLNCAFLLDRDAEPIVQKILQERGIDRINDYVMRDDGFFLLMTDLDDVLGIEGGGKPLKALDKALGMQVEDVPS